ncbi:hypothetical protein IZ6_07580 [Terrihabitans soli]|uniref:DUF2303 family protein n=1 Tax=Terrihabitans soli TaxID=708113 RepID=A0A6S6QFZ7_9HYPH|nr:DUF2303 family protein [Terrihabitans soli]BCJ90023.1 hypothetical protein IZ6_07580 [Terrihabitans soli]
MTTPKPGAPASAAVSAGSGLNLPAETLHAIVDLADRAQRAEIVLIPTEGLGPGLPSGIPALYDRKEHKLISVKDLIESQRQKPAEIKGKAQTGTLASFIELINRHKSADSVVFAKTAWPQPGFLAVIDYHKVDHNPDWQRHKIAYDFPVTEEFKVWMEFDGKKMEQAEFAAFLEEHAAELASPTDAEINLYGPLFKSAFATPNQLIDLSRELEVFVGAKVKRGARIQTGETQLEFTTEHHNAAGQKIDIPGIFILNVRPFVDGDEVRIPVRLRYRLDGPGIFWFYQMYRWEEDLRQRVLNDLAYVGEQTKLPTFEGSPEA